jgi:hypothetical protein
MATRLLIYLVSGALLVMWIAPPEGLYRYGLIVALIIVAAYVDTWTRARRSTKPDRSNVVSLLGYRKHHHRQTPAQQALRERRSMTPVFASHSQAEAEELAQLLRGEGLRPVLVTAQSSDRPHRIRFEIRLAQPESERAQALVKWFKLRAGKHPN